MKRFIRNVVLFILPFILLFALAEYRLTTYPSVFNQKAEYFKENLEDIEVLFLGSSHNELAINPEAFTDLKVSNIAFAGQDLQLESLIVNKYIGKMDKLQAVVVELSYHTLEHYRKEDYHRRTLYYKKYKVKSLGSWPDIKRKSILLSAPKFYFNYLFTKGQKDAVRKDGYSNEKLDKATQAEIHRRMKDSSRFENHHNYEDESAFDKNAELLSHLTDLCAKNQVQLILSLPPVHSAYANDMIESKKLRRSKSIMDIKSKYPNTIIWDMESSHQYPLHYFRDGDHLNHEGALAYSTMLNQLLTNELY